MVHTDAAGDARGAGYQVGAARLELPGQVPLTVPRLTLDARHEGASAPPVRIFLGTELAQHRAERIMLWSIAQHASPDRRYEVTLLRDVPGSPRKLGWATGFSNFRFLVPLLAGARGKAIYNDVDQVYLADPAELFDLPMEGCGYRAIGPRETSVMLLDCRRMAEVWRPEDIDRLSRRRMVDRAIRVPGLFGEIDQRWNKRDQDGIPAAEAKVYHFTTLHMQPWRPFPERFVYHDHPDAALWWDLRRAADAAGFDAFARAPLPGSAPGYVPSERVAGAPGVEFGSELRALLDRAGAETLWCVGAEPDAQALGGVRTAATDAAALAAPGGETRDAALWVVGREGVEPDDVPRILDALFARSRALVYVCAGYRPGRAGVWWRPPRGSVGTERWWLDQLRAAAARHPEHRWELDLQEQGGQRRLRPGGGPLPGGQQPRVWLLADGRPHHDRLGRALADAVGWSYEVHQVREGALDRATRGVFGRALGTRLRGATARGLEGLCVGAGGWPELVISAGEVCRPRAQFLREASGHRSRVVQIDSELASPTAAFDLVVTPPSVGALAHPRRVEVELLEGAAGRVARAGGLREAIGARAFARPGNDRGTTRPQLGFEALFSRLLAEGLATAGAGPDPGAHARGSAPAPPSPDVAATPRVKVLACLAERVRALVTRRC